MPILNYTTAIKTEKTASEIQAALARAGASAVMTEYENGIMSALAFRLGSMAFLLPINIEGVFDALRNNARIPKRLRTHEQAARVAWRIIKVWIDAQVAIVEAGQAEMYEVFLPYAQNKNGKTLYSSLKETNFKLLT